MKIIMDTHYFLWAISDPQRIIPEIRREIETPINRIFLSSISIAELRIKESIGKITIDFDPVQIAKDSGFDFLEFSPQDASRLKDLPLHHRDPFDRMLIAQAIERNYHILSDDEKFALYDCELLGGNVKHV